MTYKADCPNSEGVLQSFVVEEFDDHIVLCVYSSNNVSKVNIPSEINNKPVTIIGGDSFAYHDEITTITFPNTLKAIEAQAFAMCKGIKELTLPDGIETIERHAFRDCTGLKRIVLPASLKTLKTGVFAFCHLPNDAEIVLNEGLERIESGVFSSGGINQFFKIRLPDSIETIADGAFDPGVTIITNYDYGERWFVSPGSKCLKQMISSYDVRDNIIAAYRSLKESVSLNISGMITENEMRRLVVDDVMNRSFEFLRSRNIQYRFTPNNWPRFLEDHKLWLRNLSPNSEIDLPWLCLPRTEAEIDIWEKSNHTEQPDWAKHHVELCAADKSSFFDLMTAFGIPVEYFEPAADDVVFDERKTGIPSGACGQGDPFTVYSKWTDADNLLRDPAPIGKKFTLFSDLGLKAVITVEEKTDWNGAAVFVGKGTIEGYTTKQERRIEISTDRDGNIISILYPAYPEDYAYYSEFPLWQKAIEYGRIMDEIWRKAIDSLILRFYYVCKAQEENQAKGK